MVPSSAPKPMRSQDWVILAGIVLLGVALRIWAATGDVWIDEIWTLKMLGTISHPHQVFTELLHDNNHHLNSLYLLPLRDSPSSLSLRAFSIALGGASMLAAFWAAKPYGKVAAFTFAGLVALTYPMIHYGSEARGYSGLILASLLALGLVDRHLSAKTPTKNRFLFALVFAFGLLSHLTMIFIVSCLGLWAAWVRLASEEQRQSGGLSQLYTYFLPAACVPIFLIGALRLLQATSPDLEVQVGGIIPFAWVHYEIGYGRLLRMLFGMPDTWPSLLTVPVLAGFGYASFRFFDDRQKLIGPLVLIALVILPLAMGVLRLPNLNFPRYFMFAGLIALFWLAVLTQAAAERSGWPRRIAAVSLVLIATGQIAHLSLFLDQSRGHYRSAITAMATDGGSTYHAREVNRTFETISYFDRVDQSPAPLTLTPVFDDKCSGAEWYIVEMRAETLNPPSEWAISDQTCTAKFDLYETYTRYGLSGISWALYRRKR